MENETKIARQRVYERENEKGADITKSEKQEKKLVLLAEEDGFQKIREKCEIREK